MAEIYDIPSGPKNLGVLFPTIVWETMSEYFIEVTDSGSVIATSPTFKMGCCCDDDDIVLHFLNSLGRFDTITFAKPNISNETSSSLFYKEIDQSSGMRDYGFQKLSVNSNDIYEAKNNCLNENDLIWARELLRSPKVYLQVDEQFQIDNSIDDDYLAVTVIDGTFELEKNSPDGTFALTIKFKLSIPYYTQRN